MLGENMIHGGALFKKKKKVRKLRMENVCKHSDFLAVKQNLAYILSYRNQMASICTLSCAEFVSSLLRRIR